MKYTTFTDAQSVTTDSLKQASRDKFAMRPGWRENACSYPFFQRVILTHEVGQTELVFWCAIRVLLGLCVQDYKSLVMIIDLCHSG